MCCCRDIFSTVPLSIGAHIFTFISVYEAILLLKTSTNVQRFLVESMVVRSHVALPLVGPVPDGVSFTFRHIFLEFILDKCANLQRIQNYIDTTGLDLEHNPKLLCHGRSESINGDFRFYIPDETFSSLDYFSFDLLCDARCARRLRVLSIRPSAEFPLERIHAIRDNFTSLECLHISTTTLPIRSIQSISSELSHLGAIELEFEHHIGYAPFDFDPCISLVEAIAGISNLRYLNLRFRCSSQDRTLDLVTRVLCGVHRAAIVYLTSAINELINDHDMLSGNRKILNAVKDTRLDVTIADDFCETTWTHWGNRWPPNQFIFQLCLREGHLFFVWVFSSCIKTWRPDMSCAERASITCTQTIAQQTDACVIPNRPTHKTQTLRCINYVTRLTYVRGRRHEVWRYGLMRKPKCYVMK